ncbi:ABC transporter permease [Sinomonas sp. ASV322]|uniref:ABC transporter permease n=1 Tax=Sinomonas sp. ASV322 TaxID=3041920 RepID=UPI0027DD3244|nr:ABC transporter permease [Sinomonas sp. ASV322]MDQ4504008.1 ABC transporter permease [Sinomonas sp. ASV322]
MKSETADAHAAPLADVPAVDDPLRLADAPSEIAAALSAGAIGGAAGRLGRRLFGRRTAVVDRIAFGLVLLLVVVAVVGSFARPYDPFAVQTSSALLPPSSAHLLGTDDVGRDVLSRLLAGAGLTLLSAAAIVVLAAAVGIVVASVAALLPRRVDEIIMRACDIFMSIPSLVLALGLAAALGPSMLSIIVAMVAASWPSTARLTRGILRETMSSSYVESAGILGMSRVRLMLRHVLPNSLDAIYVQASMEISGTIVMISGLAFLGVGAPPPSPDWGSMIAEGQQYITTAWWISLFPGLAISVGAIAFGLVGDAVRSFVDPTARRSS